MHHGYRQALVVTGGQLRRPAFAEIVARFAPVAEAWLSWIEPGGFIVEHIDAGPYWERWQVPIEVAGHLWQQGRRVDAVVGVPFRVAHHDWHSVDNTTDARRVALVVDRLVPAGPPSAPFQVR